VILLVVIYFYLIFVKEPNFDSWMAVFEFCWLSVYRFLMEICNCTVDKLTIFLINTDTSNSVIKHGHGITVWLYNKQGCRLARKGYGNTVIANYYRNMLVKIKSRMIALAAWSKRNKICVTSVLMSPIRCIIFQIYIYFNLLLRNRLASKKFTLIVKQIVVNKFMKFYAY